MDRGPIARRSFLLNALAASALMLGAEARAQPASRVFRIGVLANHVPRAELELGVRSSSPGNAEFTRELDRLGWRDGANIRIVWRSAEGRMSRHPELAAELARMPVDVIVGGDNAVVAAMHATRTIPVVAYAVYSPVESGYAKSLNRPGANLTGIANAASDDQLQKPLALLKEAFPGTRRVALVAQSFELADGYPGVRPDGPLGLAASALGLDLFFITFGDPRTLPELVRSAARRGAGALMIDANYAIHQHRVHREGLNAEAIRQRLPAMHLSLIAASQGALMSYGTNLTARWRRAAHLVDRILRGENPGDIPIEHISRLEFHVNRSAARAMGQEIPPRILLQADRVFD